RVDQRAAARVGQELLRHLAPPLLGPLLPAGARRTLLCMPAALELVIARGVEKERLDRRRRVVHRRGVDADNALLIVQLEAGTQSEPRDTVRVDAHQVQARDRYF